MDEFDTFFADNFDPVVRALRVAVGDPREAEDLAQEAFTRAFRRWRDVAALERPAAWVYVVAIREFGHRRRRASRRRSAHDAMAAHRPEVDPWAAADARTDVSSVVAALPPRQRIAIVLRYHAGLSLEEVAQAMGCAVGTVKATLHAALGRLRVDLASEDEL
jgi:RNA polymerase sigma-70 factor (ECF subfamily)